MSEDEMKVETWNATESNPLSVPIKIAISSPVYHCPRHGEVSYVQTLWKDSKAVRHWCGECYIEMIDTHCQVVTQVGEKTTAK